ncbi:hypothetical protein PHPALM_27642, partial [Phytophthora palmivora]
RPSWATVSRTRCANIPKVTFTSTEMCRRQRLLRRIRRLPPRRTLVQILQRLPHRVPPRPRRCPIMATLCRAIPKMVPKRAPHLSTLNRRTKAMTKVRRALRTRTMTTTRARMTTMMANTIVTT